MPLTSEYLRQIEQALAAGNATEHTHRPALKAFVESLRGGIVATNEPKRVQYGAPDFVVTRGETPLGYIEAKDVGTPLEREEKGEQMARYLELGNVVLTDYLEFRWYVNRERRDVARLASKTKAGKLRLEKDGAERVEELLSAFLEAQAATVGSPKELAVRMARIARLIRGNIRRALAAEDLTDEKPDPLHDQLASFREVLLHDLTEEQFADMYAQTICYGLFAARCNARGTASFTRDSAARLVPKTNPFLQKTFYQMVGPDLSPHVAWAVDDLVALLAHADVAGILEDFGRRTRREDPVVHFYETFLAEYDPRLRETRGVYYTPEPVVSYIVRSVDHLLKTEFKLRGGLADASKIRVARPEGGGEAETHKVLILDPATGTGTFLYSTINHIYRAVGERARGAWPAYVAQELLPRLFGFELLMAPYTVAHLKLGLLLQETGVDLERLGGDGDGEAARLRVYLTNTLEEVHRLTNAAGMTRWLSEESDAASRVKQERPVMVVMGNPPYSGHSANVGQWIADLLRGRDTQTGRETENYFAVDGQPLGERQPKWLNDDYVKFIRFSQWRIEQTGYGVLAFITNHGYLDNPTFRGMRQSLMQTFDDIYVLDLHGNSKKKERAPDGGKDENVFDIQQGVAIGLFVKHDRTKVAAAGAATVRHAHLWGVREIYTEKTQGERELSGGKYQWLWQNDVSTTEWTTLEPHSPFYFFMPQDVGLLDEYEKGWKVSEAFPIKSIGVQTHRDAFAVSFDEATLRQRGKDFSDKSIDDETLREKYDLRDSGTWKLRANRQKIIGNNAELQGSITRCIYRPFDFRWILYHDAVVERRLYDVMGNMLLNNLSFMTGRQSKEPFAVLCSDVLCGQHKITSVYDGSYLFPLYLYPLNKGNLFDNDSTDAPGGRRPNLSEKFVADFAARLGMRFVADGRGDRAETFGPEDVFAYMYAVFHSPTYRSRYAEFLKIDFPRLPLTSDAGLFRELCRGGDELVSLHLLEKEPPPTTTYPNAGANEVEQVRYTAPGEAGGAEGRVWINREQFFAGVAPEVWNFHVGGYQVASKWLKDRKGRRLTYEDVTHYQRVVAALGETLRLMSEIDAVIERRGGWPLK